jgi:hypothetical protein
MLVLMLPVGVVLFVEFHKLSVFSIVVVVFIPCIMITWCVLGCIGGGVYYLM